MKSNVPWSVKGIDPDARSVAKELARRKGMTLGEWMTAMIKEKGLGEAMGEAEGASQEKVVSGVTTDQLRAVVDTLNRLNDRLKATEKHLHANQQQSKEAMGGLNKGLETVFERVKRLEQTGAADPSAGRDIAERLDRLEGASEKNSWVRSLVALEKALSTLVEQVESSRDETESRLSRNEDLIKALTTRIDSDDDALRGEIGELIDAIDKTSDRLAETEEKVAEALAAAQEAANSRDETFVERTSQRLQLLGSEIKRTSDQMRVLESSVGRLSEKIEAGEERSAEGISRVAQSLETLRREVEDASLKTGPDGTSASVTAAVEEADRRIGALQGAFSSVVERLEGRVRDQQDRAPFAEPSGFETSRSPVLDDFADEDDEDEFDRVFDDPLDLAHAAPPEPELAPRPHGNREAPLGSSLGGAFGGFSASQVIEDGGSAAFFHEPPREPEPEPEPEPRPRSFERETHDLPPPDFSPDWITQAGLSPDDTQAQAADREALFGDERPGWGERLHGALRSAFGTPMENNPPLAWVLIAAVTLAILVTAWRVTQPSDMQPQIVSGPAVEEPEPVTPVAEDPTPTDLYAAAKQELAEAVTPSEIRDALDAMTRAARAGSAPAQFELGEVYLNGEGVPTDLSAARRWFSQAAQNGHVRAIHRLAILDIEGSAGARNVNAAIAGFERAANAGLTDAMFNLGFIYLPGQGYLPDERRDAGEAYYWFRLAERQGDQAAAEQAEEIAPLLDAGTRADLDRRVREWQAQPLDSTR